MLTVVCYDIPSDQRRDKIATVLEGYGNRVQFSVFECDLTAVQLGRLKTRLKKIIDQSEDSIRYYHLCGVCVPRVEIEGNGPPVERAQLYFVV